MATKLSPNAQTLKDAGYRNTTGLRYGADVDVWVLMDVGTGMLVVLHDITTDKMSAPFYAENTR